MLDRQRIRDALIAVVIAAILCSAIGRFDMADKLFTVFWVLVALFMACKTTVLPKIKRDIFEDNVSINEFRDLYNEDPDFQKAVSYAFNLNSYDFLKFTRLLVELRHEANSRALKDAADLFRRSGE